jgi:LPS O-antigen subunit length determinant protein (WzzB/FepE family)
MTNMNQTQITTNMLASFSEMLTTLIDQRLTVLATRNETPLTKMIDQRVTAHRMLAEAKRDNAIGELVALKMKEQGMKTDYALDVKMKSLIDERVRQRLTEVLPDAVREAVSDSVDDCLDEALDDWMDATANVKRLTERLDIEVGRLLEGRTMMVTITDR